ncbi:DNA translocase FtsK [Bienertia sinuspersici]
MASREGEFLVDLECGGTTSQEEGSGDAVSGYGRGRKPSSRAHVGSIDVANSSDSFPKSNEVSGHGVELLVDKSLGGEEGRELAALLEKRNPNEQRKKVGLKNASKPPRPPKGPLLTASDLKLVKELSELAARKRARIERIKAVRKMKDTKRPTSGSSVTALVITVLFFFIIVFQGVFSGNNFTRNFQGSPAPATASDGLISIHLFNNAPSYEMNQPISLPPNSLEVASGSSPQEQDGRDAG